MVVKKASKSFWKKGQELTSLGRDFNVVGKNGKELNMILRFQGWVI